MPMDVGAILGGTVRRPGGSVQIAFHHGDAADFAAAPVDSTPGPFEGIPYPQATLHWSFCEHTVRGIRTIFLFLSIGLQRSESQVPPSLRVSSQGLLDALCLSRYRR